MIISGLNLDKLAHSISFSLFNHPIIQFRPPIIFGQTHLPKYIASGLHPRFLLAASWSAPEVEFSRDKQDIFCSLWPCCWKILHCWANHPRTSTSWNFRIQTNSQSLYLLVRSCKQNRSKNQTGLPDLSTSVNRICQSHPLSSSSQLFVSPVRHEPGRAKSRCGNGSVTDPQWTGPLQAVAAQPGAPETLRFEHLEMTTLRKDKTPTYDSCLDYNQSRLKTSNIMLTHTQI